ncbi:MAG TPA: polyprenyl synthetase family protein [Syntrophorhabdaceae bacterium]|nr:polyprenyl synthetase family protein [Syntrophorhabdaceae bacterium]HOL05367.1 polyprenyl synthetase family protein [Syntrophorhabdaceae bacterium]HON85034.1 polyprenyl synthetase family protein [Syntrophorhabdaceae bacterium]HOT41547.1 polyprenyl synthetase family protein [Syntrophorhabdaceae bacterium]HPC65845.1 polyprenyl synthetase family protein [Syntrophorhabdaceae bacterium]
MDLLSFLHEKRIIVENALRDIFVSFGSTPGVLRDAMEYMLFSNGKRIRPILAIAACEAKGKPSDDLLPVACAIEMIHTYSLIHDDLPSLDNDDIRRGRPTCHKVFGDAVAILAGDALLTEAFRIIVDSRYTYRISPRLIRQSIYEIATAAGADGMVGGQVMDVLYDGKDATKNILHYIHMHKTTALIRASVRVGAIMAGAKARELKNFTKYGECIGLAFQIMDDILDAEGDEELVGKRLKKDTGKQTYIKHYGISASKIKLEQLIEEAVKSIDFLGENSTTLKELARFIGNRSV